MVPLLIRGDGRGHSSMHQENGFSLVSIHLVTDTLSGLLLQYTVYWSALDALIKANFYSIFQ